MLLYRDDQSTVLRQALDVTAGGCAAQGQYRNEWLCSAAMNHPPRSTLTERGSQGQSSRIRPRNGQSLRITSKEPVASGWLFKMSRRCAQTIFSFPRRLVFPTAISLPASSKAALLRNNALLLLHLRDLFASETGTVHTHPTSRLRACTHATFPLFFFSLPFPRHRPSLLPLQPRATGEKLTTMCALKQRG